MIGHIHENLLIEINKSMNSAWQYQQIIYNRTTQF